MVTGVRVRLFADAREIVGHRELLLPIPAKGPGLDLLLRRLRSEYPGLGNVLRTCRFALNGEYVTDPSVALADGDELGIHPPYSGG
jgi:molybdopterin converting factor small subunit